VRTQRLADEVADAGEFHDLVKQLRRLAPAQSDERRVDADVLGARQVRMEPRAQIQQRRDSAVYGNGAHIRRGQPRHQPEQRALSRPFGPTTAKLSPSSNSNETFFRA
jgi:hypothetical protein